jgi:glutamate carboxypeptidase
VGLVSGGTGVNVVPAHCAARVETRVPSMAAAEAMCAAIEGLTPHDPDVRIAVRGGLNRPPYEKTAAIAALFAHAKGLAAEIGFALQDTSSGGGSDGNFTAATIATLDGLGVDGEGAHTDREQLYITSLEPRAELLYRLIATLG